MREAGCPESEPCSEDGTQCYGAMVGRDLGMEVQMIASGGNGFGAGNHSGVDWTEPSLNFAFFQQLQYDARLTNLSEFVPDVMVQRWDERFPDRREGSAVGDDLRGHAHKAPRGLATHVVLARVRAVECLQR